MGGVYAAGRITGAGRDAGHSRPSPAEPGGHPLRSHRGSRADTDVRTCVRARLPWRRCSVGRSGQARTIEPPSTLTDFSGSGRLGGAGGHRAVRDRELAAVARADDHAVGHRLDLAALVGAGRRERLEVACGRLGDDHVLVGEHGAAADRDAGGRGQASRRRSRRGRRARPTGRPGPPGRGAPARSRSSRRRRRSAAPPRRRRRRRRRPRACSGRAAAGVARRTGGWGGQGWVIEVPCVVGAVSPIDTAARAGMVHRRAWVNLVVR